MRDRSRLQRYRGKFAIVWTENGRTRRISTGCGELASAKRFYEDWLTGIAAPSSQTINTLWQAYCAEKADIVAVRRMGSEWKALAPIFGDLDPAQVTKDHCDQHIARRRNAGIKDGTIWTELGDLSTVLHWAVKREHINRAPHIWRPPKPVPRDRFLRQDEIQRFVAAAEMPHVRLAIILMLGTAARVGAVLDLTWDRVSFEQNQIRLALGDGAKRKGRATVPMNRMVRAAMEDAQAGALTDYVIEYAGRPVGSIRRGFKGAAERANLEGVTPHVLRHTAARQMAMRGVPMAKIAQYLGHSDSRITERVYARFAPDFMSDAADALDFEL